MRSLEELGWDAGWDDALAALGDAELRPGRVATPHAGAYVVHAEAGELWAAPTGTVKREGRRDRARRPTAGDWVALRGADGDGLASLEAVLPRRTKLSRKTPKGTAEQVLAANVDTVFIATALPADVSERRLERYLAMAHESGARPVVVLTKADLAADVAAEVEAVRRSALDVAVLVVSARAGTGVDEVRGELGPGTTAVFVGSSGVGKSSLINRLVGEDVAETAEVRSDWRGRHATTTRQLYFVPGGGVVIDTPGLRELRLWELDEGLDATFPDVAELAERCRFADCSHQTEPACAVREAVERGELGEERYRSYLALSAELDELDARRRVQARRGGG